MTFICSSIWVFRLFLFFSAPPDQAPLKEYDLAHPDTKLVLPLILHEISGITVIDENVLACVQDENGYVFFYDLAKNEIKKQYAFHINGDYEEIVRVDDKLYILRSDGMLFEISAYEKPEFKVKSYPTGIPSDNNEGLCYDSENNRLLIAAKGKTINGVIHKRAIYAFDLKSHKLGTLPAFELDVDDIKNFALKENIPFPKKVNKKNEVTGIQLKFRPSAIAFHPISKSLYLLSAGDHCLFIFNRAGSLERIELLDPVLFNKSEGIAFFSNGDMMICNEGQDKKPTLLRFNYHN